MHGWNGRILRVDLSKRNVRVEEFGSDFALSFLGGRGARVLDWISITWQWQASRRFEEPLDWRVRRRQLGFLGVTEIEEGWIRRCGVRR